ncbi:sodium:proton antiporter [Candidatus Phycorickettsia trachydisci]|uniref:Na(+)/H(+) antiporter NhaA n=1 Tax=Candidatus Phycorickettsia trachydisci TaxID=2115978 RepID=A0A2P1P9Z4_9RICK|nr:Na+/H+ antiporter NhaA [Candidatus Phycorickettsia trachydisci]AVP88091.1 sodium:proton antiporter [Candidatus Phycorickettsia trachydisci]
MLKKLDLDQLASIIMILAALLALAISNTPLVSGYEALRHFQIGALSFEEWVKDLLMAIFFLKIALELKLEFYEGCLKERSQIILPLIATAGGVIFPAIFYWLANLRTPDNLSGFAIPCATDIAFAICIFNLVAKNFSNAIKIFLLSIAIFDDLAAMLIIAIFYNHALNLLPIVGAIGIVCIMFYLHRQKVANLSIYLVLGIPLWLCFYFGGVHTTMSGVLLGAFIPMLGADGSSPLKKLAHTIHHWVNFLILPIFAFVASGVSFLHLGISDLLNPIPLGIILGLFLGKQVGIFACTYFSVKNKIAEMPEKSNWFEVYGVSVLAGIGFTMSLFMSFLAFEDHVRQDLAKIGILFSSVVTVAYASIFIKLDIRSAVAKSKVSLQVYSNDIRERVIAGLRQGQTYNDLARNFNISPSTVEGWYEEYKKDTFIPAQRKNSKAKIDLDALEEYVRLKPHMKLEEAAKYFGFSKWTIRHWLKQLGYRYERKPAPAWRYAP